VKRTVLIIGISVVTLGGGFTAFVSSAGANGSAAKTTASSAKIHFVVPGKASDFTLFDGTGLDISATCRTTSHQRFTVYMSFRAITADAMMRVTFGDGDWVDYPIPQDTSFSLQQTAGSSRGVDGVLTVSEVSGNGDLVGWMSAARIPGSTGLVACYVTED
jgi:hypothetical protein